MNEILQLMFDCLSQGKPVYLPSKFWDKLNDKNIKQLESDGIDCFKQTIAQNYFTWVIGHRDQQFSYLLRKTRLSDWPSILRRILNTVKSPILTKRQQIELTIFTRMLWKFAERVDRQGILGRINEPEEGKPFNISLNEKLISQDLANSVLEYYSIRSRFPIEVNERVSICELGGGYGRNAFVFLKVYPKCKYIMVDIPPALFLSQHYLSTLFSDRKIFRFRCFNNFKEVEREFLESDLVFLLPHQAEMIPRKCVDLFINISSLHEMKYDQVHAYFSLIDRLTRGYFYTKQWFVSRNQEDDVTITAGDYPVPDDWKQLYFQEAKVQTHFFEAMYSIDGSSDIYEQ